MLCQRFHWLVMMYSTPSVLKLERLRQKPPARDPRGEKKTGSKWRGIPRMDVGRPIGGPWGPLTGGKALHSEIL